MRNIFAILIYVVTPLIFSDTLHGQDTRSPESGDRLSYDLVISALERLESRMDSGFVAVNTRIDEQIKASEARLDAKLGAQTEAFDAKLDAQTKVFDAKLDAQTKAFNARLDAQTEAFNARLDAQTEAFNTRFDDYMAANDRRLKSFEFRFENTVTRIYDELQSVRIINITIGGVIAGVMVLFGYMQLRRLPESPARPSASTAASLETAEIMAESTPKSKPKRTSQV